MICQTKTLPSLEQVTNRSPVCEKATWRTWDEKTMITGMVKAGFNLISVTMQHCGKDSGCLIDESFVLVQPSRSTFPQPAKPVRRYKKEKRNHLVEENLREKSLQRRRFHRGPSLDAANHWEQTRPEANVWEVELVKIIGAYCHLWSCQLAEDGYKERLRQLRPPTHNWNRSTTVYIGVIGFRIFLYTSSEIFRKDLFTIDREYVSVSFITDMYFW